jgi:hypothetical protein
MNICRLRLEIWKLLFGEVMNVTTNSIRSIICEYLQNAHLEGLRLEIKYDGYVYHILI